MLPVVTLSPPTPGWREVRSLLRCAPTPGSTGCEKATSLSLPLHGTAEEPHFSWAPLPKQCPALALAVTVSASSSTPPSRGLPEQPWHSSAGAGPVPGMGLQPGARFHERERPSPTSPSQLHRLFSPAVSARLPLSHTPPNHTSQAGNTYSLPSQACRLSK